MTPKELQRNCRAHERACARRHWLANAERFAKECGYVRIDQAPPGYERVPEPISIGAEPKETPPSLDDIFASMEVKLNV